MPKKVIIIGIALILISIGLSGCISLSSEEKNFIGTWKSGDTYFVFKDNKQYIKDTLMLDISGNWKVEKYRLIMSYTMNLGGYLGTSRVVDVYSYKFSNNNQNLNIINIENDAFSFMDSYNLTKI